MTSYSVSGKSSELIRFKTTLPTDSRTWSGIQSEPISAIIRRANRSKSCSVYEKTCPDGSVMGHSSLDRSRPYVSMSSCVGSGVIGGFAGKPISVWMGVYFVSVMGVEIRDAESFGAAEADIASQHVYAMANVMESRVAVV